MHPRIIFLLAWAAIAVAGLYLYSEQSGDCEKRGGVLVKGVFAYVCVSAKAVK
jgi:hypothetical protein